MKNPEDQGRTAGTCPPPEQILQIRKGGHPGPHAEHVETCPRCRALIRSGTAFMNEGGPAVDATRRMEDAAAAARLDAFVAGLGKRPSRRQGPPSWILPLAAVLLVAVGVWTLGPDAMHKRGGGDAFDGVEGSTLRGQDEGSAAGWSAPRVLEKDAGLEIRWRALAGARAYSVTILAADLKPLVTLPASGTQLVVPAAALAGVSSGFLRVRAMTREGGMVDSPLAAWQTPGGSR